MVGVATLCTDAGKVNEELRLGVSGGTSLDDVGPCWFPSSLDELGPGGATTGSVITELGVVWIYPSWLELELQLCEALNSWSATHLSRTTIPRIRIFGFVVREGCVALHSSEFMLGPCREAVCFNIQI